ncbi:MAG: NAD(+)/NADH kinase [Phycisphaerales bacterium]|nr:NAD(+)/NADH kinase [Phycisphaerales bacterium]
MGPTTSSRRVFIVGNPEKRGVKTAMKSIQAVASQCGEVVGTALSFDGKDAVDRGADFLIVLGGDGTLLAVCRSLGRNQVPIAGVNLGKLGYLAEFTAAELEAELPQLLCDGDAVSERMILEFAVRRDGAAVFSSLAVNDGVVHAGPPYRIIQLALAVDGMHLTTIGGDGLIVSTPVGSTAHNLSAGGPIMQGGVLGIVLTPLCAHSLSHRPLVVEHKATVEISVQKANEGTSLMVDGQVGCPLLKGDVITVGRFAANMKLVRNPRRPRWQGLVTKLHWGQSPGAG